MKLSMRQVDVMRKVLKGWDYEDIADDNGTSDTTVGRDVDRMLTALRLPDDWSPNVIRENKGVILRRWNRYKSYLYDLADSRERFIRDVGEIQ